ncbi:class I SAM-dependent RNA methyltransferase [Agromyces seonyuensis]|uniref:Class I SAM-dependent RNA methyltransferase n=1 Tax=Agromyces seonyuensis TaxID=2662446 RepID=A0A6I4P4M0_9MICO|nr:class I SAM-dependent RNA methyltransferase [Agromyces seonyuensis]MWB99865.1 class I SAM-dependent RNA methyltransferase [Agromyces seonyuensis]
MPERRTRRPDRRSKPAAARPARRAAEPRTDGPLLELEVGDVAHGGVFVARHEGRVVFVADAAPGERVVARVQDASKDRFWRADAVEVLEASPDRVPHIWAESGIDRDPIDRAGGAEFGHLRLGYQRELKGRVLADALSRFGGVEVAPAVEPVLVYEGAEDVGTGWRTRVRLHVDADGNVGPYAARSHRVVPVASLPLAVPAIERIAPLGQPFRGAEHVDLIAPSTGDAQIVVADARSSRSAPPTVDEIVAGRRFTVDRDGFWQVHRGAAETLYRAVQDAVDDALFDPRAANLDLYGGVGLLAGALLDRFGETVRLTTVEADARATEHAGTNLAGAVGVRAETARVDRFLQRLVEHPTAAERARLADATIVLDPPRSGAGREVVDLLAASGARQLVYVACDPVALGRDVGLLRAHGYELEEVRAFDLFPSTHHVEAVARLTRR